MIARAPLAVDPAAGGNITIFDQGISLVAVSIFAL
jgi:hypothetical protein